MRAAAAALVIAVLALSAPSAGCAHAAADVAGRPLDERERVYEQKRPHKPVPLASVFFAAPLHLHDGAHAEPHDLLAFVDDDSATAAAVRRYSWLRAGFLSFFTVGAALELTSTASTIVGVPLLLKDQKLATGILIGGRVVEVVGFASMAVGCFAFGNASVGARDEAFQDYDGDLRKHLGLPAAPP